MKGLRFIILVSTLLWILPASAMAQGIGTPGVVPSALTVPVGTVITVQVRDPLSSDRNRPGDGFLAALEQPLVYQGWVMARRGQTVIGRVVSAQSAGRVHGVSQLAVELTEMVLVDGQQLPIRTQLLESYGTASRTEDAGVIAAGTGIGAVIGGVAAGGKGAAIGTAAGAAAAVAGVLSTRGRPTEIYPETLLTFRLDAPLTVSTDRSQQAFLPVTSADYSTQPTLRVRTPQRRAYPPPVYYAYPVVTVWPSPYIVVTRPPIFGRRRGRW